MNVWWSMEHRQVCPVFLSTRCLNSTPSCQLQHDPMMPDPMKRCHDFHVQCFRCASEYPDFRYFPIVVINELRSNLPWKFRSLDHRIQSSMSSCRSNVVWWSVLIQAPNCRDGFGWILEGRPPQNPSAIWGLYFIFRRTQMLPWDLFHAPFSGQAKKGEAALSQVREITWRWDVSRLSRMWVDWGPE